MKKILFTMLAVAALVGCSKEEILSHNKGEAISFGNNFIDNATRAAIDGSYTTATLDAFKVYGAVETTTDDVFVNIFNGVDVTKEKTNGTDIGDSAQNTWWYNAESVQYWIDGKDYKFAAVVDGTVTATDAAGMPTKLTVDATAQKDLLYASSTATSGPVAFTFKHLMSKVKFSANVAAMADAYSYRVTGISVNGVADGGVYTIGAATPWAANNTTYDLAFGNIADNNGNLAELTSGNANVESNYARLLVPQTVTSVSFTIDLYKDSANINTEVVDIDDLEIALEAGHAYNFTIDLAAPGAPIMFGVTEVEGWINEPGTDIY